MQRNLELSNPAFDGTGEIEENILNKSDCHTTPPLLTNMKQLGFISTEYCGLCRSKFPSARLYGSDAWQSDFRAVLHLNLEGETSVEITNVATFGDMLDKIDVTFSDHGRLRKVTVSRTRQSYRKWPIDKTAFCIHDWCYNILKWGVRSCPEPTIYKLVRTLALESSNYPDYRGIEPENTIKTFVSHAEVSSYQPPLILMLPLELRRSIWEYVGPTTAYSALILVNCEATRLASSLHSCYEQKVTLRQGLCLSVEMVSIFGSEYIQKINTREAHNQDSNILGVVKKLQYVASMGGICAVKIFGIDWNTGWLGQFPNNGCIWYATAPGLVLDFDCVYNDLNCVGITIPGLCTTDEILWDQSEITSLLCDPDTTLFDANRDFVGLHQTTEPHGRKFFKYLSLSCGSEYISALTVHISVYGIVGLEAHFTGVSHLSGNRDGCAIHFPLLSNERIAYVWLRLIHSCSAVFAVPALVIQTTLGRLQSFGPHIVPSVVASNTFRWILLKSKGHVSGFYYESPTFHRKIMRLGITSDETSHSAISLMPQFADWLLPSCIIANPNNGLFLSVASLSNLKRVELCRIASRCIGLLIHYLDGSTAVLGQWILSQASQHSCVYESNGPEAKVFYFRAVTKSRNHSIVLDVGFSDRGRAPLDINYTVVGIEQHIAWWFSESGDVIHPWEGRYLDIPKESKMLQR